MKSLMSFLLGIVLTIVGAVLFLSDVRVTPGLIFGILFLLFIISIILSMKFHIMYMSAFEVILILMTFFGGIGLTLRGIVHSRNELGDDAGSGINDKVNRK